MERGIEEYSHEIVWLFSENIENKLQFPGPIQIYGNQIVPREQKHSRNFRD